MDGYVFKDIEETTRWQQTNQNSKYEPTYEIF